MLYTPVNFSREWVGNLTVKVPGRGYGPPPLFLIMMATTNNDPRFLHLELTANPILPTSTMLNEIDFEVQACEQFVGGVIGGLKTVGYWLMPSLKAKLTASDQKEAVEILTEYDGVVADEPYDDMVAQVVEVEEGKGRKTVRRPRLGNGTWWVAYALAAREKFPNPSDTVAQRRSIHTWISENMREAGVTTRDRAYAIPRAVEWAYVPTEAEVSASKDRQSVAVARRLDAFRRPWWSYWWGLRRPSSAST